MLTAAPPLVLNPRPSGVSPSNCVAKFSPSNAANPTYDLKLAVAGACKPV